MKKTMKQWLALVSAGVMTLSMASCSDLTGMLAGLTGGASVESIESVEDDTPIILKEVTTAKNVILMIGDGMGPNQIKAGELYRGEALAMQQFPYMTTVETRSYNEIVTDSAAAATALATGVRTNNGVVGKNPAGEDLETIVDIAASLGKRTGIIATEDLWGATPMGFSSHADSRNDKATLLTEATVSSNVNLFLSYAMAYKYRDVFPAAGFEMIDRAEDISEATTDKVFGGYLIDAKAPSMSKEAACLALDFLVTEALEYLSKDEDGFFLMTEGSHIDHGGHENNFTYMLEELLAFDDAVKVVLEWAKDRDDTVVIVTADHETGGLQLAGDLTHEQVVEMYGLRLGEGLYWTTTGHSATDVNCYINGANIDFASYSFGTAERIKNTDVFEIMKSLMLSQ
ncbi:MAG: alkaline phosphatase [Clostridia bacterium]|nr:alkaline phosphatase [Clostridia bacterium]